MYYHWAQSLEVYDSKGAIRKDEYLQVILDAGIRWYIVGVERSGCSINEWVGSGPSATELDTPIHSTLGQMNVIGVLTMVHAHRTTASP